MPSDIQMEPIEYLPAEEQIVMYRVLTGIAFDSLVQDVLRGKFGINPRHATLLLEGNDAAVFALPKGSGGYLIEEPSLLVWARDYVIGHVFGIEANQVQMLYLDGEIGGGQAYLMLAGDGLLITSGHPQKRRGILH